VWNYELFEIDDDSISLGKIISAILILVFGILIAGRFSRLLRSHILDKTPLNENATAAFEKMIYYMSLIGIILYALTVVSIPLTVFAFFGGAIAIAVGFGAHHIINNFISGFILMIERPIRIGDLVELNGIHGHIRHIGARSTRLHTSENIDLLIPNSQLLENVVTNWTLTDEKLRTSVTVGVVYGAPTERVMQLLMEATTEAKGVLPAPKPVILFTDFSDNALIFEIHFWVKMRRIMDKRLVESTIRFNIDRLFRENDIIIAFPQRDVHIDTINPIEIRMVDEHKL
jgi:potassium-dependent mechanosensitive channel